MKPKSNVLLSFVALVAIVTLSGCAPAAGTSTPVPSATRAPSPAPASSDAPEAQGGTGPFPCDVFSLAYIRKVSGYDVVAADPVSAIIDPNKKSCEYVTTGKNEIGVLTDTTDGTTDLQIASETDGFGSAISGIGDSAVGNQSHLGVRFGDTYIEVEDDSVTSGGTVELAEIGIETLKTMVLKIHAQLP